MTKELATHIIGQIHGLASIIRAGYGTASDDQIKLLADILIILERFRKTH